MSGSTGSHTKRVLIVGGGIAGLATALELSGSRRARERMRVTVIDADARFGGKLATLTRSHGRIEEHGVHLLQGWYHTTLRLFQRVLEDSGQTLEDALSPLHGMYMADPEVGCYRLRFPPTPMAGPPRSLEACLRLLIVDGARWLLDAWGRTGAMSPFDVRGSIARLLDRLSGRFSGRFSGSRALRRIQHAAPLLRRLSAALKPLQRRAPARVQRSARVFGIGAALTAGLLDDAIVGGRIDPMRLDGRDFRAWLAHHGASPAVLRDPLVRWFYNILLASSNDPRDERLSAGTVASVILRSMDYRGAMFWRFRRGTWTSLIRPIVDWLRARGVELRSRCALQRFEVRGERVEAAILSGGERLDAFDHVVLAVPPWALGPSVAGLASADSRWRRAAEGLPPTATAHAQLWLRERLSHYGWNAQEGAVMTSGPWPFQSWMDMSHVLPAESWPAANAPGSLLYLTCACDPGWLTAADPQAAFERALRSWLRDRGGTIWPDSRGAPRGWPLAQIIARDGALFRVNHVAWSRYGVSIPGSAATRLAAGDTGLHNLTVAGDWTATEINGGCVEAAVRSAVAAAAVVTEKRL